MVQLPTLHDTLESAAKGSQRRVSFAADESSDSTPQKDLQRAHGCSTSQPIHLVCTSAVEARPSAQQGPTTASLRSTPAVESVPLQHQQQLLRCGHAADKGRRHNMEDAAVIASLEGSVMPDEAACASPSVLLAVSACQRVLGCMQPLAAPESKAVPFSSAPAGACIHACMQPTAAASSCGIPHPQTVSQICMHASFCSHHQVFDGHSGADAAEFASQHILHGVKRSKHFHTDIPAALVSTAAPSLAPYPSLAHKLAVQHLRPGIPSQPAAAVV